MILRWQNNERGAVIDDTAPALRASGGTDIRKMPHVVVAGRLDIKGDDYIKRVYDPNGISPCLPTMQGGMQEPKVLVNVVNGELRERDDFSCLDANYAKGLDNHGARTGVMAVLTPDREEKRQNGRRFKEPGEPMFTLTAQDKHDVAIKVVGMLDIPGHDQKRRVYDSSGLAPTLNGIGNGGGLEPKVLHNYRIRKLTPLECFRLQGYPDEWYHKCKEAGISDSQMYKMAGNGVSSPVAREIGIRLVKMTQE